MKRSLLAGAVCVLLFGGDAMAQDPPPQQQPAPDAQLVFEREVFTYPSFTRRNPFRALGVDDQGGPRFERLTLIGIMYSPDPAASVAVVTTGGVTVAEDGTLAPVEGEASYLKVGERLGNTTIVEIRRDAVIIDVEIFDALERHTMNFISRRPGGTP